MIKVAVVDRDDADMPLDSLFEGLVMLHAPVNLFYLEKCATHVWPAWQCPLKTVDFSTRHI